MLKVVICGNCGVGKSETAKWFRGEPFCDDYQTTPSVDVTASNVQAKHDEAVKLVTWDITGNNEYSALTSAFYQGANVIILMFDITDKTSFADIDSVWLELIRKSVYPNRISSDKHLLVVGNKADLESQRQVERGQIFSLADEIGALCCIETSAKTGMNMKRLLEATLSSLSLQ